MCSSMFPLHPPCVLLPLGDTDKCKHEDSASHTTENSAGTIGARGIARLRQRPSLAPYSDVYLHQLLYALYRQLLAVVEVGGQEGVACRMRLPHGGATRAWYFHRPPRQLAHS